jgi:NTP pyrophosphatase (non-canonical NTP hydrolase)
MIKDTDLLTKRIVKFRDNRDWKQFHNSKDLSLALSIEAAELNELFLWKKDNEADKRKVAQELADVLIYALLLAHENRLNIFRIVTDKLHQNERKYPVRRFKGSARKYNEKTK